MLENLPDLPQGVVGVKAIGRVSKEDYVQVFEPILERARRDGRRIRFLYVLGPECEGFTAGAAWEDAKLGLSSLRLFEGCAIVSDSDVIRGPARLVGFFMPCPVQVFRNEDQGKAVAWLASLPEGPAISHRLLPESGVIVVDVKQALRAQDFDAVALTADTWIEAKGSLRGVVIHAREFPGWENIGGLLRHLRFVRDHHREVKRIALASDSKLASLVPRIGEHFVKSEVKSFGYNELEKAISWAGNPD